MKWVIQLDCDLTRYLTTSLKGSADFLTGALHSFSFSYTLDNALA